MRVPLLDVLKAFLTGEFYNGHHIDGYILTWERPNSRHSESGLRLSKTGGEFVPFWIRLESKSNRLRDFCEEFGTRNSTRDKMGWHFFAFHQVWLDMFLTDGDMDKTFLVITPIEEKADV